MFPNSAFDSTCAILSCTPSHFRSLFDNQLLTTDTLSNRILSQIIPLHRQRLLAVNDQYELDLLLTAMLEYAPHILGRRYVAVSLIIANDLEKGSGELVVEIAKAWMYNMICPLFQIFEKDMDTPRDVDFFEQTPFEELLSKRAGRCSGITGIGDIAIAMKREYAGEDIGPGVFQSMAAAQIIPNSLCELLNEIRKSSDHDIPKEKSRFGDMFLCWTRFDIPALELLPETPHNAIYMTLDEEYAYGRFFFYLDGTPYPDNPNKYRATMGQPRFRLQSNSGQPVASADVELRDLSGSGIGLPDPKFIEFHAALARVYKYSGVGLYLSRVLGPDFAGDSEAELMKARPLHYFILPIST